MQSVTWADCSLVLFLIERTTQLLLQERLTEWAVEGNRMQQSINWRLIWTVHILRARLMSQCSSVTLHLITLSFCQGLSRGESSGVQSSHCHWHTLVKPFFSLKGCCSLNITVKTQCTRTQSSLVNNTSNLDSKCYFSLINLYIFFLKIVPQKGLEGQKYLNGHQYSWSNLQLIVGVNRVGVMWEHRGQTCQNTNTSIFCFNKRIP